MVVNVNTVLLKSPMDNYMMLIHQISKVGGDLLNPKLEYLGLSVFDKSVIPVWFTSKSILTINEMECPSWDTIKAVKDLDTLKAVRYTTPSLSYFTIAILTSLPN